MKKYHKFITSGRDKGKENFPEDGEEMHYVVSAGWDFLLSLAFLLIITATLFV